MIIENKKYQYVKNSLYKAYSNPESYFQDFWYAGHGIYLDSESLLWGL